MKKCFFKKLNVWYKELFKKTKYFASTYKSGSLRGKLPKRTMYI